MDSTESIEALIVRLRDLLPKVGERETVECCVPGNDLRAAYDFLSAALAGKAAQPVVQPSDEQMADALGSHHAAIVLAREHGYEWVGGEWLRRATPPAAQAGVPLSEARIMEIARQCRNNDGTLPYGLFARTIEFAHGISSGREKRTPGDAG